MAVLTPISDQDARAICKTYALGDLDRFEGIAAGSVNTNYALWAGGARYFLRLYEEQSLPGAVAEATLLSELSSRGVPVAAPLPRGGARGPKNGPQNEKGTARAGDGVSARDAIAEAAGKPVAVFPWRDGGMRCQASVGAHECFAVGAALAKVHRAGEGCVHPAGRFGPRELSARLDRIETSPVLELASQAADLRAKLETWQSRRDPSLPRGLVHGDLFRDNVLWNSSGEIAALLDFESASDGVLAYDLMVTALAWTVGDSLDFSLLSAMIDGYESVRPLAPIERRGMLAEGCLAAIRFTITRITDYAMRVSDGPRVMKDWRRFRTRLDRLESLGEAGFAKFVGA